MHIGEVDQSGVIHGLHVIPPSADLRLYLSHIAHGRLCCEDSVSDLTLFTSVHAEHVAVELFLVSVEIFLIIGIGQLNILVLSLRIEDTGDTYIRLLLGDFSNLVGKCRGHIECALKHGEIFATLTVVAQLLLVFEPLDLGLQGVGHVGKLTDIVADTLTVVLTSLGIGELLQQIGVDEATDVHITYLSVADSDSQCGNLFVKESLLQNLLPYTLLESIAAVATHLIVLLHLSETSVKIVISNLFAIEFGKGRLFSVLGKVANDEGNNGYTDNQHCQP